MIVESGEVFRHGFGIVPICSGDAAAEDGAGAEGIGQGTEGGGEISAPDPDGGGVVFEGEAVAVVHLSLLGFSVQFSVSFRKTGSERFA
jgi:hypothetical protein